MSLASAVPTDPFADLRALELRLAAGPGRDDADLRALDLRLAAGPGRDDADLPRPQDDRVEARGVWMIADDDERLLRGAREGLWNLQRTHQRPARPRLSIA